MDLSRFRSRYYYPAIERIGVTKRPPYACRHTYATMLKNIDAPTVGHASYTMTAHYTHSDIKSLTAITDELGVEKLSNLDCNADCNRRKFLRFSGIVSAFV